MVQLPRSKHVLSIVPVASFYQALERIQNSTSKKFIYIQYINLYTIFRQKEVMATASVFLSTYGYRRVHGLTINTFKAQFLYLLQNSSFVLQQTVVKPNFYQSMSGTSPEKIGSSSIRTSSPFITPTTNYQKYTIYCRSCK